MHHFRFGCLPAHDFHVRFRHGENLCEKTNQRRVGFAIFRYRGNIDLQCTICKCTFHFRTRRTGMDTNGECHFPFPLKR